MSKQKSKFEGNHDSDRQLLKVETAATRTDLLVISSDRKALKVKIAATRTETELVLRIAHYRAPHVLWRIKRRNSVSEPTTSPATTIVGEDVYMQYITSKEEDNKMENEGFNKLKGPAAGEANKSGCAKCVPLGLREVADKCTDNPNAARRDNQTGIRIGNLGDYTTDTDLEDLVKPFGPIGKQYLARNKQTGVCKGFAFIHFKFRDDAARAIQTLNGYRYNDLILNVHWAKSPKPSTQ